MPVIPVNGMVDKKKWMAEEEERHKGSLTLPPPPHKKYKNSLEYIVGLSTLLQVTNISITLNRVLENLGRTVK
jgi:hypothetical protein